jgi:hypothetical protein
MALTVLRNVARRADRAVAVRDVPESVAPDVQSRDARGISIGEMLRQAWVQQED